MKKVFLIVCAAVLAAGVYAADMPKQGFGLQIGWAQPILRLNSMSNPSSAKDSLGIVVKMNGFKVGMVYDGSIIKGFGTSIGVNYTFGAYNSGWKTDNLYGMPYPRKRQLVMYHEVELFVDWQYKFEIAKETYLMLYSGPTIQCGVGMSMRSDKQKFEGEAYDPVYYNGFEAAGNENEHFKRINVTWGVGAGFQYKRYFLRGGYDFGLINPYANSRFMDAAGNPVDRYTRGRLDQWNVKIGIYLWYAE